MFSRKDYQKAAAIVSRLRASPITSLADIMSKGIEALHYEEAYIKLFSGNDNFNVAEFKKKSKNQWGVVVGKPKKEFWDGIGSEPNLHNIGTWCVGGPNYTSTMLFNTSTMLFNTREEARRYAKRQESYSAGWHYHAKKYSK